MHILRDLVQKCDINDFEKLEAAANSLLKDKENIDDLVSGLTDGSLNIYLAQEVLGQIKIRRSQLEKEEKLRRIEEEDKKAKKTEYDKVMNCPDFQNICKKVMELDTEFGLLKDKFDYSFDFTVKFNANGSIFPNSAEDALYNPKDEDYEPFEFGDCELKVLEEHSVVGKEKLKLVQDFLDNSTEDVCELVLDLDDSMKKKLEDCRDRFSLLREEVNSYLKDIEFYEFYDLYMDFKNKLANK